MTEPNETAEPSGASGGSGVCPYVTGTVTRYCTLTPFTLTDAERTLIEKLTWESEHPRMGRLLFVMPQDRETARGLLERTR